MTALDGPGGEAYDENAPPPPFGHALLKYFGFEEGYINLNHGLPLPNLPLAHRHL